VLQRVQRTDLGLRGSFRPATGDGVDLAAGDDDEGVCTKEQADNPGWTGCDDAHETLARG
jgi:hypothetical protein